ncbi:unnamed protein product [Linum tenue]|uniref:Autophagy-related protein 18a n=1 Tax=Linum tenue TaxID=586396 RepID=A0AAV0MMK4_9ROSI|nr:unnamed protein product [Linum tenue]
MATLSAYSSPAAWPNDNPNPAVLLQQDSTTGDEQQQLDDPQSYDSLSSITPQENHQPDPLPQSPPSNPTPVTNYSSPISSPPESSSSPPPSVALLHLSFNQDSGCFAAGTDHGFRIYNCDPFREIFRRDFDRRGGGIGAVEMLFRCNILALVGGGADPQYPPNKVMIWDDHQSRCIGELSFRSEVRAVKLRRDRIVVVLEQKIFVYNFSDLKLLHQIETIANPKGLCEVSHGAGSLVLVCPGLQKGQVRVEHYASKRTKFVMAHDSRIACFALTQDGQLLATCSSKGTLVRIFNTADGSLLQEVRRGADRAEIYSLAFSSAAQWLAVSSDKGTVHVFSLKLNPGAKMNDTSRAITDTNHAAGSPASSLSFFKGICSLKLEPPPPPPPALIGETPRLYLSSAVKIIVEIRGHINLIKAFACRCFTKVFQLRVVGCSVQFDPVNGGEMKQLEYHNFMKPEGSF